MVEATLIQQAADKLHTAEKIAVLTGAGVSKESGVPTFRDAQEGLWEQYNPEELATPRAFKKQPKLVWDWYEWRRSLAGKALPNPGHIALADLEAHAADYVVVITQNVDDLHEQAGSTHVIHLHGNLAQNKCFNNCQGNPTHIDVASLDYDPETADHPPQCPHCGAYVRPDVVLFGEMLPDEYLTAAFEYSEDCDVMLVIGTSGLVSPASRLPRVAQQAGATLIEVNPDDSMITRYADIKLEGKSGEVLPQLIEALNAKR